MHQMEKEMASKLEKEGTGVEGNMEEEDLPKQVRTLKSFLLIRFDHLGGADD